MNNAANDTASVPN